MRWLLISDLHSNLAALQAALEESRNCYDRIACLGDVVGYGPQPNEVVNCVRAGVSDCIRGNHDRVCSGLDDPEMMNYTCRVAARWTASALSEENREYLRGLPTGPMELKGFSIAHGAVSNEDKYVVTKDDALSELRSNAGRVIFFGHSHHQGGYMLDSDGYLQELKPVFFRGQALTTLRLREDETYLLNPGSVGQPRDGDARAAFAIFDSDRRQVEFWRVPYDVAATQAAMRRENLPDELASRLDVGR